jgi:hypothetical protein
MRLVRWPHHAPVAGPDPEVVLGDVQAPCGGADPRGCPSGRAAVQVVERIVVTHATQAVARTPMHQDWIDVLRELSRQLDRGLVGPPAPNWP